jgi:hypothetical protein
VDRGKTSTRNPQATLCHKMELGYISYVHGLFDLRCDPFYIDVVFLDDWNFVNHVSR